MPWSAHAVPGSGAESTEPDASVKTVHVVQVQGHQCVYPDRGTACKVRPSVPESRRIPSQRQQAHQSVDCIATAGRIVKCMKSNVLAGRRRGVAVRPRTGYLFDVLTPSCPRTCPAVSAATLAESDTRTVRGGCPHDCPDTCATITTVEHGRATRIAGDPDHPFTSGFLCAKVNRYLERTYHRDRLLHPLRRVGTKGTGSFVGSPGTRRSTRSRSD